MSGSRFANIWYSEAGINLKVELRKFGFLDRWSWWLELQGGGAGAFLESSRSVARRSETFLVSVLLTFVRSCEDFVR